MQRADLTEGSLPRHLFRLGAPMTVGIMAIISFHLADIYFVGLMGTTELAALSFTMPVTMVVFSLLLGFSIAMSSVVSRQIGEGNHDRVIRLVTHGLTLVFAVGCVIAVLGITFLRPLFTLMGATDETMPFIVDYMMIWFAGNIFISLPMCGNSAIRATGNTMYPAIIMTIVSAVNIALDPVFIFGFYFIPAMGIKGAAIATIIANILAMIALIYMLGFRKKLLRLYPFYWRHFADSVKRLCYIAVPAGITSSIQPLTNMVIISLLAGYGKESVAGYGIVSRIEAFAFVVLMGLSGGMSPILGQNWGAKLYSRVTDTLKTAIRFSMLWSLFIAVILTCFAKPLATIFSDDPEIIKIASLYFYIVAWSYVGGNLLSGWASAFNAIGKPERSALMIFIKYIIIQIPFIFIGAHFYSVKGIFIAIALCNFLTGVSAHLYSRAIIHKNNSEQNI